MAKVFQPDDEETGSLASLNKRVSQIPAGGATRSLGNASAGLGMMDGQQAPLAQPVTQAAPVQQRTVAAGAIPFKSDAAAAMFRNTREADKAITGVTGVTSVPAQPPAPQVQAKSPAELHQEKLAAAQASQQAYASVPKRGEYSEANTQAYLSALDKSKAMQPSYYSQETPNGAQNRAQADQAANAALASIDSGATQRPAGALPPVSAGAGQGMASVQDRSVNPYATTSPSRGPSAQPAVAQPATSTQAQEPATVLGADGRQHINEVVSSADHRQSDVMLNSVFNRPESSQAGYAARVNRLQSGAAGATDWRTPDGGGVMANSGADMNIRRLKNDSGAMDTANKAWAMRGAGVQASRDANGGLVLSNSSGPEKMSYADKEGKPTTDFANTAQYDQKMAENEKLLQQDEMRAIQNPNLSNSTRDAMVTLIGSRRAAVALKKSEKMDQEKFNIEATGAKMENEQKANLMAIQKAMFDPKATPEQRAEATKQFMALNGKSQQNKYTVVPGGQMVIDGQAVTQPSMVFDNETRQFINPNQGSQQANATSKADYDKLPAGSVYTGQDGKQYKKG